jgi:type IV pilus assembly protein PilB
VHTNDAAGAVTRLIDMGIEPFLVASVLMVSFAQRLVRRVCPECRESYTPSRESLGFWGLASSRGVSFQKAVGCDACRHSGYHGRCGIFEVLVVSEKIQQMIAANRTIHEIAKVARDEGGMTSLREDAAQKLKSGITTPEEAMSTVIT